MEKEKLESLLIDYLDNNLNQDELKLVEDHLLKNEEAQQLLAQLKQLTQVVKKGATSFQPSASMPLKFQKALANEIALLQHPKQVFMLPAVYKVAAAIGFILVSVAIGYWVNRSQQQAAELTKLKLEMEETKKILITMLDNHQSASQRVQAATIAFTMTKPDYEVVNALVKAMNEDSNTNVRLAALDALSKFYHEEPIRKILIRSLAVQKDEVVQIALIQVLVKMKEKSIIKDLEKLTQDTEVLKAVKDEAFTGILKLS